MNDFEQLFETAPFGYLVLSPDDTILRVNGTAATALGTSAEHIVGRRFVDLLSGGARVLYETRYRPVLLLQGAVHDVALTLQRDAGDRMPVTMFAQATEHEVRVGFVDATARQKHDRDVLATRRAAEVLAARVTVLQNAAAAFSLSTSHTDVSEALAQIVEDALVASDACVAFLTPEGELEVTAGINPLAGKYDLASRRPGARVVESERPIMVSTDSAEDAEAYPSVIAAMRGVRVQSIAIFPLLRDGAAIGVVAAFFAREREIEAEEQDLIISIARQAAQVITRLRAQHELARLALHDHLTGLANRRLLRESITLGLEADATSEAFSVMFVDLDGFKMINDQLGHHAGDEVLREVASRLRSVVRDSDEIGRYGGDEFVIICAQTTADRAAAIGDRIRDSIRRPYAAAPEIPISASIGIVTVTPQAVGVVTTDQLLRIADEAMYESKSDGRDRVTQVVL